MVGYQSLGGRDTRYGCVRDAMLLLEEFTGDAESGEA